MLVRAWRFATLLLVALTTGLAFCHLMEMPVRLRWPAELWIRTTNEGGLYYLFGTVGAVIDLGALIAAVALVFLVRRRGPAFVPTLIGALLLIAAHAAWWLFVAPVNAEMAAWSSAAVPPDFEPLHRQWEYAHAVRALVQILALAALVLSVLVETPRTRPQPA